MADKLVHFELPADNTARAREFWGSLFGWSFRSWEGGPVEYHMTEAGGAPGEAVYPSQAGERGPIVYFDTEQIDAHVARACELGGEAEDKHEIPGVGWSASCRDSEGNPFSLFQSAGSAE